MKKKTEQWLAGDLNARFTEINFPEYQREPNIWELPAKQRLIDSMLRGFDIAALYFYVGGEGTYECIDGRQRINAIASFLGNNPKDPDNGFPFRASNEIYEEAHPFGPLNLKTWKTIEDLSRADDADSAVAALAMELLTSYEVSAVLLSDATLPEEFNLQFTRLNLGVTINAGEKLNAMIGNMRDLCFDDPRIGQHPFLARVRIPTRRYAKEQVATQIVAQAFSLDDGEGFTAARHFDLQKFLKRYAHIPAEKQALITTLERTLDTLGPALDEVEIVLRSRAVTVSVVLLAWELRLYEPGEPLQRYVQFVDAFLRRLRWQVRKGLDVAPEYRYLVDFQRHVTQASVEKAAVNARHDVLLAGLNYWFDYSRVIGDEEYEDRTGEDPEEASKAS